MALVEKVNMCEQMANFSLGMEAIWKSQIEVLEINIVK